MVSVLRNIKFNTVHNMTNRKNAKLQGVIGEIFVWHRKGEFHISTILMEWEFNALEEDIINRKINFNPEKLINMWW